jgi:hypothetical protein
MAINQYSFAVLIDGGKASVRYRTLHAIRICLNSFGAARLRRISIACLAQRRGLVHRDVIALDFVLRLVRGRMMRLTLVIGTFRMHLNDLAAVLLPSSRSRGRRP